MEIKANIKQVNYKILVSGDKEVYLTLSIVGEEEVKKAMKLSEISSAEQIIIKTG